MSLLTIFQTIEKTPVGLTIRDSQWLFPIIEGFHLLGLGLMGGVVLLVNMRMLGLGLGNQSASQLEQDARPYFTGSLILMLLSGFLLFTSEAVKCYYNQAFWFKMTSLLLAIVYTTTLNRRSVHATTGGTASLAGRAHAIITVLLWTGVGVGGRWIGFS